jgi:mono/diheme cytochrome c family protein
VKGELPMRYFPFKQFVAVIALSTGFCIAALAQSSLYSGVGATPTQDELGPLAIASGPSGKDLPPGRGTAKQGAPIYMVKCAMCHGRDTEGVRGAPSAFSPVNGLRLGGGNGVPAWNPPADRIVTMATYVAWPTSIFNTIAVEMPFFRPGTLTPDEAYALTAFVLFKNGIVKEDDVMNRETLPKIQMPNHHAFRPDADNPAELIDIQKRGCIKPYGVCR